MARYMDSLSAHFLKWTEHMCDEPACLVANEPTYLFVLQFAIKCHQHQELSRLIGIDRQRAIDVETEEDEDVYDDLDAIPGFDKDKTEDLDFDVRYSCQKYAELDSADQSHFDAVLVIYMDAILCHAEKMVEEPTPASEIDSLLMQLFGAASMADKLYYGCMPPDCLSRVDALAMHSSNAETFTDLFRSLHKKTKLSTTLVLPHDMTGSATALSGLWESIGGFVSLETPKTAPPVVVDVPEPPPSSNRNLVSLAQLFSFADSTDVALMVVGSLSAAAAGVSLPLQMVLYGDLVNAFNPTIPVSPAALRARVDVVARNFALVGVGVVVCGFLQVACWSRTASRQSQRLRGAYVRALLAQDPGWFDVNEPLALASRAAEAAVAIQNGMGRKFGDGIHYAAMAIAGVTIALFKGWELALVLLAFTPAIAASGYLSSRLLASATQQGLDAYGQAGAVAQEALSNIRTVHTFNAVTSVAEKYARALQGASRAGVRKGLAVGAGMGLMFFTTFCTYAGGLFYGAVQVANAHEGTCERCYDGGRVVAVFFCTIMGAMALGQAGPSLEATFAARAAAFDVFALLQRQPAIDARSERGATIESLRGEIALHDVCFAYPSRPDVPICVGYSLTIQAGETVALVGPSGSGKSTIVALLERFYDPQRGSVTLDGVDLRELNVAWLRAQIGLVGQEPALFATSILENIRYGSPNATDAQVIEAAEMAGALAFIRAFPQGFETQVGERGAQLSGGQKQRLAIARALVKNPKILLLDEATSALDAESERAVQASLDALLVHKTRTTIVIAHRLSTVRHADRIAVLDRGAVVELGTHSELMEVAGGHYRGLVEAQHEDTDTKQHVALSEEPTETVSGSTERPSDTPAPSHVPSTCDGDETQQSDESAAVSVRRVWKLSAPEWKHLVLGAVGAVGHAAVFPLWGVLLIKMIVLFFEDKPRHELLHTARMWSLGFLGLGALLGLSLVAQHYGFAVASQQLTARVRLAAFSAMLRQEIGWFDRKENASGALVARLATDAATLQAMTSDQLNQGIVSVSTIAIGFGIAFYSSWEMTLVLLATAPLFFVAMVVNAQMMTGSANTKAANDADAQAGALLVEAVGSIRTVASLRLEDTVSRAYEALLEASKRDDVRRGLVGGAGFGVGQGLMFFNVAFLFYIGGKWVASGRLTFEDMARVVMVVMLSMVAVGIATETVADHAGAKRAARRVFRVIDRTPQIDATCSDGVTLPRVAGSVTFEAVAFAYPSRSNTSVYEGYSLTVGAGETVALVGASGSGKSTAVALLERFYDPAEGRVTLDGVDLRELSLPWLREQLALVGQEPVLFAGSIADNIALGKPNATREEIEAAARTANAWAFISQFPLGLDTDVGDHGAQVSGGQKQRIAIARAVLRDPAVLLLDEATSALDAESERAVQHSLDALLAQKTRTTIVVAHRLSTIRHADRIAVVQDGRIVEQGSHEQLMARPGGAYRALVAHQVDVA